MARAGARAKAGGMLEGVVLVLLLLLGAEEACDLPGYPTRANKCLAK